MKLKIGLLSVMINVDWRGLQFSIEINLRPLWCCFPTLRDCCKRFSQPIISKTKANCDLVARIFTHLKHLLRVPIESFWCLRLLVITDWNIYHNHSLNLWTILFYYNIYNHEHNSNTISSSFRRLHLKVSPEGGNWLCEYLGHAQSNAIYCLFLDEDYFIRRNTFQLRVVWCSEQRPVNWPPREPSSECRKYRTVSVWKKDTPLCREAHIKRN